jgi:hypothetical protein
MNEKTIRGSCNTPGVDHQLNSGFKIKHDGLSGDDDVKAKPMEINPNLNLDVAPFFAYRPFLRYMLGCCYQSIFTCLTSITIYIDPWKSFMQFGIKKSHEMISSIPTGICPIKLMEL